MKLGFMLNELGIIRFLKLAQSKGYAALSIIGE